MLHIMETRLPKPEDDSRHTRKIYGRGPLADHIFSTRFNRYQAVLILIIAVIGYLLIEFALKMADH